MTLTKEDLSAIRGVVKEEVQSETRKIIQAETPKIVRIETGKVVQSETREIVQSETRKIIKEELLPIENKLTRIENKFDELFDFLDKKYLQVKEDVREIQTHLHLPVSEF